ncbi:hypothetical protein H6B15_02290 [Gemmiger formicilis]|nr:hypothetical protein [Gemmiger formicilis]
MKKVDFSPQKRLSGGFSRHFCTGRGKQKPACGNIPQAGGYILFDQR